MDLPAGVSTITYTYAGTGYANPHAVTQVANGISTSTYAYDNDGNLIQKTTDGVVTSYMYDYTSRLIVLGVAGATTTYGYDAFGARVLQIGTSTTISVLRAKFKIEKIESGTRFLERLDRV
jgi:YD repeat-containing protein